MDARARRPRHFRDLLWDDTSTEENSPGAMYSISAEPLPGPPDSELENEENQKTIRENPDLFKIVCNIDIDRFEALLVDHPNPRFVASVIRGLREGFWPWAEISGEYPVNRECPSRIPATEHEQDFLRAQIEKEIKAERFSPAFGDLLPGMYEIPVHAVPKPGSFDLFALRMVVDHSAGDFSPNSMITKASIAGVKLDGIKALGSAVRAVRRKISVPTVSKADRVAIQLELWKSDVKAAYRQMPMHPLWQLKQVVNIFGKRHVDRCNNFGGRGSMKIWASFISLVIWIAIIKRHVEWLMIFVDDHFGVSVGGDLEMYEPYGQLLPAAQTKLLMLWDEIRLPHDEEKQVSGRVLPILGFTVDINANTVTMPVDKRDMLADACIEFGRPRTTKSLRECQRMLGWMNWALNAYPKLRPGLSGLYAKIAGLTEPHTRVRMNTEIAAELIWFANRMRTSAGVHFLTSVDWAPGATDEISVTMFTDASMKGMGVWFLCEHAGFQSPLPEDSPSDIIFFFEALAVVCGIWLCAHRYRRRRLICFSDNTNTVDAFASMSAAGPINKLLRFAVDILLEFDIDFRCYYVPGPENVVADALSRFKNEIVHKIAPNVVIQSFTPPQEAMGSLKK